MVDRALAKFIIILVLINLFIGAIGLLLTIYVNIIVGLAVAALLLAVLPYLIGRYILEKDDKNKSQSSDEEVE